VTRHVPLSRTTKAAAGTHLRVMGGEFGGRRLSAPRGIRPTQGLVKEAVFNILGAAVDEATVLDLFAGSGALGIEALSRGAATTTFVDNDDAAVRVIRRNLGALGLGERARVVRSEVTRWLATHPDDVKAASLVLLDPPYNDAVLQHALALLDTLVAGGTTVVAEHAHRQPLPALDRLQASRLRRYGDTAISLLEL
jgi:16S rRNA (guanine966-N2)-methyltransferase